jgi:type I restriction enzyme, S subunit
MRGRLDLHEVHEIELFDGELEKFRLRVGDLLVVEGNGSPNQIGRAARWRGDIENCVHQNHLIRVRPGAAIDSKYLTHYWNASRTTEYLRSIASSTSGLYVLTAAKVRGVHIPLPPMGEQRRIVAAIEEQFSRLDAGVAALERVRQNLKRMRSAVLRAAVSGVLINADAEEWTSVTLGEILEDMHAGKSFKCVERPAGPDEWGVVKVSAMTWGEFRETENKTVGDRTIDPRFEIRPGDLLVSRANTVDYVGAVVLVRDCRPRLLLSDKSLRLVPTSRVLPEWLVISLRADSARRYIESVATGTSDSMRNISQPKLKALAIMLPPLEVQAQLVSEVGRMMSLVEQLERSLAHNHQSARALRAAILGTAFSGKLAAQDASDEPASALLTRIATERASSNGRSPGRTRKPRIPQEKAVV